MCFLNKVFPFHALLMRIRGSLGCDYDCTYCGPRAYCEGQSPFRSHNGVCQSSYSGDVCDHFFAACGTSSSRRRSSSGSASFSVQSGPCTTAQNGQCVGRPGGYSHNEDCLIRVSASTTISSCPIFSVEQGYVSWDYFYVFCERHLISVQHDLCASAD